MGYNQFSHPRAEVDLYQPIDDNIYLHGYQTLYNRAKDNAAQISSQFSNLFGINAYGKDSEILSQLENDAKVKISELAKTGLDNDRANSQINSLISQYSNNPDVLAIKKRSAFFENELKNKKAAEEKGLPYYSRSLEQLNNYYSQPNYYRNPEGVSLSQGFTGVNLAKARNEALREVPKEKYLGSDGFYYERYNQKALEQGLNSFYTDPRVQKQMLYDIEEKYKNTDWDTEGINQLSTLKQNAQTLYQEALKVGRLDLAQGFLNDINNYDLMASDPKSYAEQIKSMVYNKELQDRIDLDKRNSNFNSVEKANEYQLKAQELQKQKEFELYKRQLDTGLIEGIPAKQNKALQGMNPVIKKFYEESIKRGVNVIDSNGNLIPPQDLPDLPEKKAAVDAANKDIGTRTINNLVSKIKAGVLNETDEKSLLTYVKNNRKLLGLNTSDDIQKVTMNNGNVVVEINWGKDKEYTPEEFEKLVGNTLNTETSTKQKTYKGLDANGDPIFE